jgi:group I intron endonuclease
MICGIYKIENLINGKIYIGQSIEIEQRWKKHLAASDDFLIHKALRKYGKENFSFTILEECDLLKLDERE